MRTFIPSSDISLRSSVVAPSLRKRKATGSNPTVGKKISLHEIRARLSFLTTVGSPCNWNQPWHTRSQCPVLDLISKEKIWLPYAVYIIYHLSFNLPFSTLKLPFPEHRLLDAESSLNEHLNISSQYSINQALPSPIFVLINLNWILVIM